VVHIAVSFAKALEANFPELLHRMYVVNGKHYLCIFPISIFQNLHSAELNLKRYYLLYKSATWTFTLLLKLVRPFLSTATHEKFQIFGTDSEQWKVVLLKDLPENAVPNELGGTAGSIYDLHM